MGGVWGSYAEKVCMGSPKKTEQMQLGNNGRQRWRKAMTSTGGRRLRVGVQLGVVLDDKGRVWVETYIGSHRLTQQHA